MGMSMKIGMKVLGIAGVLLGLVLGGPALAQSNDFSDDPGASTQRDEGQRQGVVLLNRTIQGRTRSAVSTGFYGNFFSGAGTNTRRDGDSTTVVAGADDGGFFNDFWNGAAIWANTSVLNLEDDVLDFESDSQIVSFLAGFDKFFWDDILIGAVIGRTSASIKSVNSFAGGINTQDASADTDVFSVYGAYVLNDFVYFDAAIGLGDEDTALDSNNLAGVLLAQNQTQGTTRFASIGATVAVPFEDVWLFTGSASFLRSITNFDAIRDRVTGVTVDGQRNDVTLVTFGGQVARAFNGGALVPYLGFMWEHNYQDQPIGLPAGAVGASGLVDQQVNDQSQGLLTLGMDFFPTDHVTVSMEGQRYVARAGQVAYGGFFNFRYNF